MEDQNIFNILANFLKISLNELRKYAILTDQAYPKSSHNPPEDSNRTPRSARNQTSRRTSIASVLQLPQKDSLLPSHRVSTLVDRKHSIMQLQDLTEDPKLTRKASKSRKTGFMESDLYEVLECFYLQSIILSIGGFIKERYKKPFIDFLARCLHAYSQTTSKSVAKGILARLGEQSDQSLNIFESFYDVLTGQWKSFSDYNILSDSKITSSFTQEEFSKDEKARFLPDYKQIENLQTGLGLYPAYFCLTGVKRKAYFVLEHLVNYDKSALLLASAQQGKTAFLDYFSQNFESHKLVVDNTTTKRQV